MIDRTKLRKRLTDTMMDGWAKIDRAIDEQSLKGIEDSLNNLTDELERELISIQLDRAIDSQNCGKSDCRLHGHLNRSKTLDRSLN